MFENPDFQVDEQSEEFRLLNPLVSKISEKRKRKLKILEELEAQGQVKYFPFGLRKPMEFSSVSGFQTFHPRKMEVMQECLLSATIIVTYSINLVFSCNPVFAQIQA